MSDAVLACSDPTISPWMLHIALDMNKSEYASYGFHLRTREEAYRQATVIRRMAALISNYRGPWQEDEAYTLPDGHVFNDWFAFVRADVYRLDDTP